MTIIVPPGISPTGERIERELEDIGTLVFENYAAGEWMTKKGEPAKKARRRYVLADRELDAVSSILGTLDKPALLRWIEDQATIGAVYAERGGYLTDLPEWEWQRRVRSLDLGASAKRDQGADRGTVIHDALHALAKGEPVPDPSTLPENARPWLRGAILAWMALGITDVIEAERIVCHPELGFAGRPDLLAIAGGNLVLLDYKTGKGKAYPEVHWQTRLYRMAIARSLHLEVDKALAVAIGDDGSFELIECSATEDEARALLAVYRARKRIESDMRSQRAIAKAAA